MRFACPRRRAERQPDTQEREWRHLNFVQFEAYIHAKLPPVRCDRWAKTTQVPVPWARPQSGLTQLMEALSVTLCQAMTSRQVAQLLGIGDMRVWGTLDYHVDGVRSGGLHRGHQQHRPRRDRRTAHGHHYISLFHNLDAPRLLFACEGREANALAEFSDDLEAHGDCAENIRNLCIDMSTSYRDGADVQLPWAAVTFDAFHVIQLVNKAIDEVRREEVKSAPSLKRSRYI